MTRDFPNRPLSVNASWDILKTLSDPTRLRLLALVSREELSVAELQEILGMQVSLVADADQTAAAEIKGHGAAGDSQTDVTAL